MLVLLASFGLFGETCVNYQPYWALNEHTTQAEPTIAVWDEVVLVAFVDTSHYNPFRPGFSSLIGYARSVDGGRSFQDMGPVLPCLPCDYGLSNPTLAVSPRGVFYLCSLQMQQGLRIGVARSEDKGLSFARPVLIPKAGDLPDLPHMAVDPITGRIYVAWADLKLWRIFVTVSEDDGRSFSQPVEIDTQGLSPKHCVRLAVGRDSRVYVFWAERGAILASVSTDHGRSWSKPVFLTSPDSVRLVWQLPDHDCFLIPPIPNSAINPVSGNIHLVFHATSNAFQTDIFFMTIDPELNVVASPKALVNEASMGKERFMPALAVTPTGVIGVIFYELEDEQLKLVLVTSTDGGRSFVRKFASSSFGLPPSYDPLRRPCYLGDYIGLAADTEFFYLAWTDARNLVKTPQYPEGRPDLDVFFAKIPAP